MCKEVCKLTTCELYVVLEFSALIIENNTFDFVNKVYGDFDQKYNTYTYINVTYTFTVKALFTGDRWIVIAKFIKYGHEVLISLQTRAQLFGTHFSPFHVSDITMSRMTVYSMGERIHHCQATSLISVLDDVNFPVTVANCVSPFAELWFSFRASTEQYGVI
jgi:hypothetical protein